MQFEFSKIIPEVKKNIKAKPNVYDDYNELMKYLETNENAVNSVVSLYPDVTMIYPINSWTFWYRDPTKLHLKCRWEESLTKIETVCDVTHLWKSVIDLIISYVLHYIVCRYCTTVVDTYIHFIR